MVKNTGGNKCKRQGRKHIHVPQQRSVRFIKEEGELYAVVTKLYGGCNCEVMCMDGKTRLCVIRNKFRGRDKGDNTIAPKVWVLVGVRDWETRQGKPQKCDLLEVYREGEKDKIKENRDTDVTCLINEFEDVSSDINRCNFDFIDTNENVECETEIQNEINEAIQKEQDKGNNSDEDDGFIDINEI